MHMAMFHVHTSDFSAKGRTTNTTHAFIHTLEEKLRRRKDGKGMTKYKGRERTEKVGGRRETVGGTRVEIMKTRH